MDFLLICIAVLILPKDSSSPVFCSKSGHEQAQKKICFQVHTQVLQEPMWNMHP